MHFGFLIWTRDFFLGINYDWQTGNEMGGGEETRISNAGISRIENGEYSEING